MTGPAVFFMVLVLHGLPFTMPQPYETRADCDKEGKAAEHAINSVNPYGIPYYFCVEAPRSLSGFEAAPPMTPKETPNGKEVLPPNGSSPEPSPANGEGGGGDQGNQPEGRPGG